MKINILTSKLLILALSFYVFFVAISLVIDVNRAEATDSVNDVIVLRSMDTYQTVYFEEMFDSIDKSISFLREQGSVIVSDNYKDKEKIANNFMAGYGKRMGLSYDNIEFISVNGKPWQESKYYDTIINNLTCKDSLFLKWPQLLEFVTDPRYNGQGAQIVSMVRQGKTNQEIRSQLLGEEESEEKQPDKTIKRLVFYLDKSDEVNMAPVLIGKTTMVPLRETCNYFDLIIEWDQKDNKVTIFKNDKEVTLTINNSTAYVGGEQFNLEVYPRLINNRTYIPIRFVSEALGFNVDWKSIDRSIMISQQ